MTIAFAKISSPLGPLLLVGSDDALTGVYIEGQRGAPGLGARGREDASRFAATIRQLAEYFAGERTSFDLGLAPSGTPFQRAVWRALERIPFGTTQSYASLAAGIGAPRASRAVGAANARNPLAVVVPCHRVVGAGGALTGYAGGIERKRWLLDHERAAALRPGT